MTVLRRSPPLAAPRSDRPRRRRAAADGVQIAAPSDDARDGPPLARGSAAGLDDGHPVARLGGVVLVVRHERRGLAAGSSRRARGAPAARRPRRRSCCILSLTTTPTISVFGMPTATLPSGYACFCRETVLTRARSRRMRPQLDRAPRAGPSTSGSASGTADSSRLVRALAQLVGAQVPELLRLHDACSCANRVANLVLIGSFAAASSMARRACCSATPSISKRIRPGRTTATHCSGRALALAHARFLRLLGDGLVGEHPHPDLAAALDEARHRDAGRLDLPVGQPAAARSPSARSRRTTRRSRARPCPRMRPRCCLRYLTFFGINMMHVPHWPAAGAYARAGRRGARYSSSRPVRGTRRSPL